MNRTTFSLPLVLISVCPFWAGCSGSDRLEIVPVQGQLTYQGKPVTGATVTFLCPGAPRLAVGTTDNTGTYRLTTYDLDDGAIVGVHTVTVNVYATESEGEALGGASIEDAMRRSIRQIEKAEKAKPPIPVKYADRSTSDLKKEVVVGENIINIELTD